MAIQNLHMPTGLDTPDKSPGFMLWKTTMYWQKMLRDALLPFGITHMQFVVIAAIGWLSQDKIPTQAMVAKFAQIDAMVTSSVLKALEEKGIAIRKEHPDDSRAKAVYLTDAGKKTLEATMPVVEKTDNIFFDLLGDDKEKIVELFNILSGERQ